MAYTGKTGLDYFPFETSFFEDDKIELIDSEFGSIGIVITIKLLCKIYKEGYFYRWGDDECRLFSRKAGAGIVYSNVKEVVAGLFRRSFFDKEVYDQFQILTSKGIQKRYFEAAERRKSIYVIKDYLLVDTSSYKNVYIVGEDDNISLNNVNINRQSKVKEKRGKESVDAPTLFPVNNSSVLKDIDVLKSDCLNDPINFVEHVRRENRITQIQLENALTAFNNHLKSGGDMVKAVKDYRYHFQNWLKKQDTKTFRIQPGQTVNSNLSTNQVLENLGIK